MTFDLQPITLGSDAVHLRPLGVDDFEVLYTVAADPLIWEQHPNQERYRREVFETFFQGAIESGGAFKVIDARSGTLIGSSRYYDLDEAQRTVSIGYTFIARSHWGKGYNRSMKDLMLRHAFRFVGRVLFEIGIENRRSRKALEKLGGIYLGEKSLAYFGEVAKPNVVYKIDAADWPSPG